MVGLVLKLVLQLVQLGDGLLEAVVLERGAGVGGQRLEQRAVAGREAARESEAVREHDRADHAILAAQHAEHAVPDSALVQVGVERRGERRRQRHRGVGARGARAQRRGRGRVDGRHRLAGGARAEAGAQRRATVGGEEDDLGLLGVEGLERPLEQALERDRDLGGLRQGAVGLVEDLDLLVALALLDVRAVADEGDQDRDQQQRRGLGPLDPEDGADERERRARDRDEEVQAEHLAHLPARDATLGEHHRGQDRSDRQHAAQRRRREQCRPGQPPESRVQAGGQLHDDDHHAAHERELREVEDELHRRQAAQQQRHERARHDGDERVRSGREDERERERDVGERERVRGATELELDRPALGDEHHQRQPPPAELGAVDRLLVTDRDEVQGGRDRRDDEAQPPHGLDGGQPPKRCANAHVPVPSASRS